jgi:hypothetical protein
MSECSIPEIHVYSVLHVKQELIHNSSMIHHLSSLEPLVYRMHSYVKTTPIQYGALSTQDTSTGYERQS